MDSETNSTRIEKLNNSNYFAWKIRIEHLLALKDFDDHITEDPPSNPTQLGAWSKNDKKAQALIALNLTDELLENVRDVSTAKEMWTSIKNVFERHTLLNELSARREFYTASMREGESVLQFSNRIRHYAATLKGMEVDLPESEMSMALLSGLPDEFNSIISALDALNDDESSLEWEFIKSRIMQEEQRIGMRSKASISKSETSALVTKNGTTTSDKCHKCAVAANRPVCSHCKKVGHEVSKCWKLYPHLNPHKKSKTAIIATQSDEDPTICLLSRKVKVGTSNSADWFIDSGCSNHMTYDKSIISSYSSGEYSPVELGNSKTAQVLGSGNVNLTLSVNGKSTNCILQNVLHVPDLGYQLISVLTMDRSGCKISFHSQRCWIMKNNELLATGTMQQNLYRLDTSSNTVQKGLVAEVSLWHRRLAHLHPSTIANMSKLSVGTGLSVSKFNPHSFTCEGCILGKGHRSAIPKKSHSLTSHLLELVHSDVNGPMDTPSKGGSKYFVVFIDDFSKWTVVFPMKKKSDTFECFKKFHAFAETHTGSRVKTVNVLKRSQEKQGKLKALRTDNGGEYISGAFKSYLETHGISHQLTIAYTPQQNGVSERMNRTLMDLVRSMLQSAKLDKSFWAEALATAVYIRNRVTSHSLPEGITPYHRWMNKPPSFSHIRVFGCHCWYVIPKSKVKKLDPRSREGIMVGYSAQSKGYKIWDPELKKMIVSRDVTFNESNHESTKVSSHPSQVDVTVPGGVEKVEADTSNKTAIDDVHASSSSSENDSDFEKALPEAPSALRRSDRVKRKPTEWWKTTGSVAAVSQMLSIVELPTSYSTAMSNQNIDFWKPGIDREHDCLTRNKTWTLVDRTNKMHVLPSKYVFKVKNGEPKVRLVAVGCRQIHGLDYNETFAPVVTLTTIRTVLALVAVLDLELEQMDVVTAFLNGDLNEDIYMSIPAGFKNDQNLDKVCKLNKSLYGLKQAPKQWYEKMHKFLDEDLGFKSSQNDPCLYTKHEGSNIVIMCLYVDDLLIAGSDKSEVAKIKRELSDRFEMKDLGAATIIVGIEIKRDRERKSLTISQHEYTQKVLARFGMENSKTVATPMERPSKSKASELDEPAENIPYRQAIGSLMYLMIGTRPDIGYAIGKLSQFAETPLNRHWIAVKRVLRYINATQRFGITYQGSASENPVGYADADWGGCKETRKSTSGYLFLFANGAISWRSKKQNCVATSTCEAEYIATCLAVKESVWLSRLIADLRFSSNSNPVTINVDNQSAITSAENTSINQRNKHIEIPYHYVRDCVQRKKVFIQYCSSGSQIADILTKPLERVLFQKLRSLQGIENTTN